MPMSHGKIQVIDPATAVWESRDSAPIFEGTVSTTPADAIAESLGGLVGKQVQSSIVRFAAGSRTVLHVHEVDQILVITDGEGHIGTKDYDQRVRAGMVLIIPAGVEHYHGACVGKAMSHLTVVAGATTLGASAPWPPAENGGR